MKRSSTTPVSSLPRGLATRSTLVAVAVLMTAAAPLSISQTASADKYDTQISALQQQIDSANAEAGKYAEQAKTLQGKLDQIQGQITAIQTLISASQKKAALLDQQIKDTETKLANNKSALGKTMASLYVDNQTTPLEMLASSKNIGSFLDKQAYQNSMNNRLTKTITEINKLEAQLKDQQTEVQRTLTDQKNAEAALASEKQQQAELLAQTQGQEAEYQKVAAGAEAQKLQVQQQQQAAIQAAIRQNGGSLQPTSGGSYGSYISWLSQSAPNCYVDANAISYSIDPLGYGCRQCVSFAAYMMLQKTGYGPSYWGHANMWPGAADAAGFTVTSQPRANSLGVMYIGAYGHIVYVQSVSGGTAHVQQYNYYTGSWGQYSEMDMPTSSLNQYIYL